LGSETSATSSKSATRLFSRLSPEKTTRDSAAAADDETTAVTNKRTNGAIRMAQLPCRLQQMAVAGRGPGTDSDDVEAEPKAGAERLAPSMELTRGECNAGG